MRFPGVRLQSLSVLSLSQSACKLLWCYSQAGQPGKWRLIVDLFSPGGASVNDGIDPNKFTLHYITVDQVFRMVSRLGRGALMATFDVEAAYRNIPVHPVDRDSYYVDLTLPFGLCSAPYIFNAVADMVEWILVHCYQVSD